MATQNTQVCCCGASTWTSVFAWLQIVGAVFGIIGASYLLAAGDQIKDDKVLAKAKFIVVLVLAIVNFVLGILLLIGNKREKLGLLWTWLIVTAICAVMEVITGILSATAGDVGSLVSAIISAAISGFMIYVVHRRIHDIKMSSSNGGMS